MATNKSAKTTVTEKREAIQAVSKSYSLCTRQPLQRKEIAKIYQTLKTEKQSRMQF